MDPPSKSHASLFQVYLRLRPPPAANSTAERFLLVEAPEEGSAPTHITLNPPNDRRRAIEKFAFTRVFEEDATQLDLFQGTKVLPLVEGVLAPHGGDGTDGLLATLGVTGSGKSHTILGSKTQRGLTQLSLDAIFRSIDQNIVDCDTNASLETSIRSSDASEAAIFSATSFIDSIYTDFSVSTSSRAGSRAATPMTVRPQNDLFRPSLSDDFPQLPGCFPTSPRGVRLVSYEDEMTHVTLLSTPPSQMKKPSSLRRTPVASTKPKLANMSPNKHYMTLTSTAKSKNVTKSRSKGDFSLSTSRRQLQRPTNFPQVPDISSIRASCDPSAEYAVLVSMYEVYNDRIFDLLTPPMKSHNTKEARRRPLLFKSTELSPDRKVVAGLRKIICGTLKEALMVLDAGLHERRVAGTGSNSVSSRSHGFFCVEVKKRRRGRTSGPWGTSTLSIVDLAGSERARDAKTQGTTLAEAGKINESLMYLGQCLQMQSDANSTPKPNLVPFRQCKLTELLFSNSFPSTSLANSTSHRRAPQKAVMIVTADPLGDFNATSQILRYSALAREVTVPRVPSITSTILANGNTGASFPRPESRPSSDRSDPGRISPVSPTNTTTTTTTKSFFQPVNMRGRTFSPLSDTERATMENAALEIARMADMIEQLNAELAHETEARMTAEAHLLSLEDRAIELEQEIREECHADFEQRLAMEMGRWKASLSIEQERGEAHWDRKVEVLTRGVGVTLTSPSDDDDDEDYGNENEDKENVLIENLEQENERLRRENTVLKRELAGRTPTRRAPLQERGDVPSSKADNNMAGLGSRMEKLRVTSGNSNHGHGNDYGSNNNSNNNIGHSTGSPKKKVRKLPAKKWEAADFQDDFM
ncbi:P-loop containing nucleoside triphosphate hydrolase protein [Camillea tinctor]|nr:P-loop containing nucleoside triphosphate hydrolase protein [Camillea tinctor]